MMVTRTANIYLIRHAQSLFNIQEKRHKDNPEILAELRQTTSWLDSPLSNLGRQQANQLVLPDHNLHDKPSPRILVSPLRRSVETALIATNTPCNQARYGNSKLEVWPEVNEMVTSWTDIYCLGLLEDPRLDPDKHDNRLCWPDKFEAYGHQFISLSDNQLRYESQEQLAKRADHLHKRLLEELEKDQHRDIIVFGHADLFYQMTGKQLANTEYTALQV